MTEPVERRDESGQLVSPADQPVQLTPRSVGLRFTPDMLRLPPARRPPYSTVKCQENQSRTFFHPSSAASVRYLVLSTEKKACPASL